MKITAHTVALLMCCAAAHAGGAIYKCTDGSGAVSYQATPCAADTQQSQVSIRSDAATPPSEVQSDTPTAPGAARHTIYIYGRGGPPPATKPTNDVSSNYKLPTFPERKAPPPDPYRLPGSEDVSYECRLPNGEVFYRHDACPATASTGTSYTTDRARGISFDSSNDVAVQGRQVSREEACRKMNSAGSIGREGRGRDQQISTYDKNLGRDPCR